MVRAERVFLQLFILILLNNVDISKGSMVGIVPGPRKGWQNNSPLILVLRGSYSRYYDKHYPLRTGDDQNLDLDNNMDLKKSVQFVKEIVESTGNKNDPGVIQINQKFKEALRSQCKEYVKCTVKCEVKTQKKKKENCQKSCKEIYDYLMMCHPPGGVKKKEGSTKGPKDVVTKDSCEWSDECKIKDTCESSDECRPKPARPRPKPTTKKDSCEWSDDCKIKDTCESSDECRPKPTRPKPKKGKTMPPKWRMG